MAAGQGFKTFVTGEVLTAGDVNGYLMQGINVFATTAARDAAITAPAEGQFAFTKDTNSLWYYDGAAWVASGATGDIEGVTAGIGISGGGTSGTVTVTNSMATAIDAKGDLVAGTGADAFSRLAVGANDTVLTADSAQATGLKWATVSAGATGWTLLNSPSGTALTGAATITVSSISAKEILILLSDVSSASASSVIQVRPNGLNTSIYSKFGIKNDMVSTYSMGNFGRIEAYAGTGGVNVMGTGAAASAGTGYVYFDKADTTGGKTFYAAGTSNDASTSFSQIISAGIAQMTAAITSVSIVSSAGNFDGGTVYVFGAN
jgi:hypothetical protein